MGFLIFVVDVGTSAHEARFELLSTQALRLYALMRQGFGVSAQCGLGLKPELRVWGLRHRRLTT